MYCIAVMMVLQVNHATHTATQTVDMEELSLGFPTSRPSESTQNTAIFTPELFFTSNQTSSQDEPSLWCDPKSALGLSRFSTGQYRVSGSGSPIGSARASTGPMHWVLCSSGCREAKPLGVLVPSIENEASSSVGFVFCCIRVWFGKGFRS